MDYSKIDLNLGFVAMQKSIFSRQYQTFLNLLREAREQADVTQVELARKLNTTQSMVSKCERGERRLDVIEVRRWCAAIGVSFLTLMKQLDQALRG